MTINEMLTTMEVAELLRVSEQTVRRWCADGTLPALKLGRRWRVSRGRLDELIQTQIQGRMEQGGAAESQSGW